MTLPARVSMIVTVEPTMPTRSTTRRAVLAAGIVLATAACDRSASPAGPPATSPPTSPVVPTSGPPSWDDLAGRLPGGLLRPDGDGWNPSTLLYNPRFTAAPQAVAPVRTADDVATCVRFAADSGTPLRLRGGGHSYGGWSADAGLVVDLAALDSVEVSADGTRATVGAGATLVDVYSQLGSRGLAIGAGSCPTVGVSGLTLGGGVGVLAPSFGLTCDQLRSANVVTADGRQQSADGDDDLFWALRGGGTGFAAVTSWEFALRPAPDVEVFFLRWPWERAADVLTAWQAWLPDAPRELWSTCKLLANPVDGDRVQVSGAWTGSASLDSALAGLLGRLPAPAANTHRRLDYAAAMAYEAGCSGLDAAACTTRALDGDHRQPFAATSSMLGRELPDAGVQAGVAAVQAVIDAPPAGLVEAGMSFDALGGAVADVAPDATAFPWRTALATVQHTATWTGERDASGFDAVVAGTRAALSRWTGNAAYVNYADAGLPDRAAACWGDNLARLREVRKAVDPDGVFASPGTGG